ncbi:MAG: hypothetical protein KDC76_14710, partial [Bacteroidetes bacterium]|nr:hypothetical protein [Bacteroidota bacterium]
MKQSKTIIGVAILLFVQLATQAQQLSFDGFGPVRHSVYSGSSHPIGKFNQFARVKLAAGYSADVKQSDHFGWGIDLNRQINSFRWPNEYLNFPSSGNGSNYSITSSQGRRGWTATTLGVGPWWQFSLNSSPGFTYSIYTKPGISLVQSPEASSVLNYVHGQSGILFNMSAQRKLVFGVTTGARFNFNWRENLQFFLNPQYVYTSAHINYEHRDLTNANPKGVFNPGLALESPILEDFVTPNYFNFNVGLTYTPKAKSRKPAALV